LKGSPVAGLRQITLQCQNRPVVFYVDFNFHQSHIIRS
jgi:hypothetical protein